MATSLALRRGRLPTFLQEQRGLSPLAVSLLACMMVLANVPGNLLGGSLLQRNFRRGSLIAFASVVTGLCGVGVILGVTIRRLDR